MKKQLLILLLLLSYNFIFAQGQFETYSNFPFDGNKYNAFVIKLDAEEITKFDIIQNDSILTHQSFLAALLASDTNIFLINAGISDTMCKPIGYYVKNSQQIQPTNLRDGFGNFYLKPNGALLIMPDDIAICESTQIQNYQNVKLGIQSGPMLINNGAVNPQFNPTSQNKNLRCGVGLYSNNNGDKFLAFAISNTPVTFYEFAVFFSKKFKCTNALCLESVGCSMYFPNQGNPNENFNGYICNYIYFKL